MLPHPLTSGQEPWGRWSPGRLFINPVLVSHSNTQVKQVCRESWASSFRDGVAKVAPDKQAWQDCGDRFHITNVNLQMDAPKSPRLRGGSLLGRTGASRDAPGFQRDGIMGCAVVVRQGDRQTSVWWWFTAGSDRRGQAPKGTGGMPRRHQMAGVEGCEKFGGVASQTLIPKYLLETRGTETSQYPEEKKSTETPSVAASERGRA